MHNYLPILIVGAVIGAFTLVFILAYIALLKHKEQEEEHEHALLEMLDEERLWYVGSMVLGMNDALVELTGSLAGFTFAMQNTSLIALSGLIMGI